MTHFVLYNTSVGPDVTKVLKLYDSLGVTVVLKWDLPQKDLTVRRYGQGKIAKLISCQFFFFSGLPFPNKGKNS